LISLKISGFKYKNDSIEFDPKVIIDVVGHSYLADNGNDIVCAAVSTLVLTAVKSISVVVGLRQTVDQNSGRLISTVYMDDCSKEVLVKFKVVIESFLLGINEIKMKYPDRVEILSD